MNDNKVLNLNPCCGDSDVRAVELMDDDVLAFRCVNCMKVGSGMIFGVDEDSGVVVARWNARYPLKVKPVDVSDYGEIRKLLEDDIGLYSMQIGKSPAKELPLPMELVSMR